MAVNSNNNSANSHDSIYFKNYIKSNKKNKIDFKEISLVLCSICFVGIISFGIFRIITNTSNKDNSINAANNIVNDSDGIYNEATSNMPTEAIQSTEAATVMYEWSEQEAVTEPVNNDINNIETSDNDIVISAELTDFYSSVKNVTASSRLNEETIGNITHNYSPSKVIDNDLSTCWCEGKDDYGIDEELTIELDNTYAIDEITIWNGLCTSEDLYRKNSRVHHILLTFSDGNSFECECKDGWDNSKNVILLPEKVDTSFITIKIIDIYEGEKYKDTCISEISVS